MIILPLFIYFDFFIFNHLFLSDRFFRCFLEWEYSVHNEVRRAVYDGGKAAYMNVGKDQLQNGRFHK